MFRILAVDDEQPVLDGIQRLVERHFTDLTVCATARSGRLAIERAHQFQPDLVLMDVNLPGISGLDAIREIRQALPGTLFILVTAYERFDIAKEAFDLGVADYLLKPVNKDKLLAVLEKSLATLRRRRDERSSGVEQLEMLEAGQFLLEPEFFRLIERRTGMDRAEWDQRLAAFTRVFGLSPAGGALAVLDGPDCGRLAGRLRTRLQYQFRALAAAEGPDRLWLFLPLGAAVPEDARDQIREAALALLPADTAAGRLSVVLGPSQRLENLDLSRQAVLAGLQEGREAHAGGRVDWAGEKLLVETLLYRSEPEFLARLGQYCRALADSREPAELPGLFRRSATVLLHALGHRNPDLMDPLDLPEFAAAAGPPAWCEELAAWGSQLAVLWSGKRIRERPPVVEKALAFIEAQYRSPVSLEDAARSAAVSPQYLSRIFSEEMHESFIDCLTRVRMNHARGLLRQGASIKTVSQELGYTDPNYFSRLFKKMTGLTPSEFART
jgi:two-component system response regulator YesN